MFGIDDAIMIGGSLLGGMMGSDAAGDAAAQQAAAGRESIAFQREMAGQQRADLQPWRQQGESALNRLNALYGFPSSGLSLSQPNRADFMSGGVQATNRLAPQPAGAQPQHRYHKLQGQQYLRGQAYAGQQPQAQTFDQTGYDAAQADYQNQLAAQQEAQANYDPAQAGADLVAMDPGAQFRSEQGNKALQNSLLARGNALSGAALKEGMRYNQGLASQEFGSAYNRLAALSGQGQNAAASQGAGSMQAGQSIGNTMQGIGNVQAAGTIGAGNAWQNALGQGMSLYGQKQGWGK